MIRVFKSVQSQNTYGTFAFFLVLMLYLGLFLRPYPEQYVGHMGTRLIDLVLLGFVVYAILSSKVSFDRNSLLVIGLLFLFTLVTILSTVTAPLRLNLPPLGIRDFLESVRYLSLAIYIMFGFSIGKSNYFKDKHLLYLFLAILGVTFLLSFSQFVIPHIVQPITNLYAPEHQARRVFTTGRVTGIFGNPNTNGLMSLVLCSGLLSYYFVYKNKFSKVNRRLLLGGIIFGYLSTLITGSTTTFLSLFILSGTIYVYRTGISIGRLLLLISIVMLLFVLKEVLIEYLRNANMYLYSRVSVLFSINAWELIQETGFFGRLRGWKEGFAYFLEAPLLGAGPLRGIVKSSTDNFYLYILMRYGIIGFSFFLVFWGLVTFTALKAMRSVYGSVRFLGFFIFMQTIIILAANITLEAQIIIPIAYMYFISLGIFLARINICMPILKPN